MAKVLEDLELIIAQRQKAGDSENSYTAKLLNSSADKLLKKIGEEATETVIAGAFKDKQALIYESCDLIYHLMVLWAKEGICLNDIELELARRFSMSGILEKKLRGEER